MARFGKSLAASVSALALAGFALPALAAESPLALLDQSIASCERFYAAISAGETSQIPYLWSASEDGRIFVTADEGVSPILTGMDGVVFMPVFLGYRLETGVSLTCSLSFFEGIAEYDRLGEPLAGAEVILAGLAERAAALVGSDVAAIGGPMRRPGSDEIVQTSQIWSNRSGSEHRQLGYVLQPGSLNITLQIMAAP